MKRTLTAIGIALTMAMVAFAGGQTEQSKSGQQIVIRFMLRDTPSTTPGMILLGDVWQRAIDTFVKAHPNVKVVNESISDDASYTNKLTADIASGTPANIFNYPGIANIVGYAKNKIILNLAPYLDADKKWRDGFAPGRVAMFDLTAYGVPGTYAVPYAVNPEPWYYNKDLFAKAGITNPPRVWSEFLADIDKLNAAGITPIGVGNKNTWRAGHIHTGIFYKFAGVDAAVKLGQRQGKWTDPDIVATFQRLLDLKDRNAFEAGFNGIDYDSEFAGFIEGKWAMVYNGLWAVGRLEQEMGGASRVGVFLMPSFPDRPFQDNDISYPSQMLVSGRLSKEAETVTIDLLKYLTGPEVAASLANDAKSNPARVDFTVDQSKVGGLWSAVRGLMSSVRLTGHDTFAYDPLPGLEFYMKDQIAGMLGGQLTAAQVGANIQEFISTH